MSFPPGAIWNFRSGFGICLRHTTTLRGIAGVRSRVRYLTVSWARLLHAARDKKGRGGAVRPRVVAYGKIPRHLYASTTRLIATMYAAWRVSTLFDSRISQTRANAAIMMPSSFWSTSDFVQKNSERFWTHSNYNTITPPPLR